MPEARPLSENKWRKDAQSLITSANDQTRCAMALLRKPVTDRWATEDGGEPWVRKPEDWREVERYLERAIALYARAQRLAKHRADVHDRDGDTDAHT